MHQEPYRDRDSTSRNSSVSARNAGSLGGKLMEDVDDLIQELFTKGDAGDTTIDNSEPGKELVASQANWYDDESDRDTASSRRGTADTTRLCFNQTSRISNPGTASNFDDSDEDENGNEKVASFRHAVPFPRIPSNLGAACNCKCFVTNVGAAHLSHPSIKRLLLAAECKYDLSTPRTSLLGRKGAFHAVNEKDGNGACDRLIDERGERGGCPFMLCRKCGYPPVRLQGAQWQDNNGTIDLYLTVRNFYPDWSRLTGAYPVGQPHRPNSKPVLDSCADAAAYCCQCSWLTVRSPQQVIETRLTDHTNYMKEGSCFFATQLPLPDNESRRPPLWACAGHLAF
uniref:Cilia- and flagella-associated protein 418 n=1 Tax=Trypanosoma congolense (strain IL3000) TaxID=1068625 RepID=G0UKY9_TRYCI|nr:conserved hypothetical protein [Trypanosoma congolense IL3000]